ncbi:MAG: hypothetical protein WCM76_08355 [Bacteroidota bacterium]
MRKFLLVIIFGLFGQMTFAQNDCGGAVTGMDLTVLSTSALRVQFWRPLIDEKYWPTKGVPEYEHYFQIKAKPYFSQSNNANWYKDVDTSTIVKGFQISANEHSSTYDLISLLPGVSYDVCIYTVCRNSLIGPLCFHSTTSLEAPCKLEYSRIDETSGNFKFKYNEFTNVVAKQILFEYREKNGEWKVVEVNDSNSVYISDLKPGETYFARIKFVYYNNVESNYSDILILPN